MAEAVWPSTFHPASFSSSWNEQAQFGRSANRAPADAYDWLGLPIQYAKENDIGDDPSENR